MNETSAYWTGQRPRDAEEWSCTDFGAVVDDAATRHALFRMYGRYVKRWNEIELDASRNLFEHTHEVDGAKVLAADGRFVLHGRSRARSQWIVEIIFSRGFRVFYPGNLGRNPMRGVADIRSVHLHWSGSGRDAFEQWMRTEQASPQARASNPAFLLAHRTILAHPMARLVAFAQVKLRARARSRAA